MGDDTIYASIDLPSQTFLVDRNLDGNMRVFHIWVASRIWTDCTVVPGVSLHVSHRAKKLEETSNRACEEEKG
jgi:hypothetical protein